MAELVLSWSVTFVFAFVEVAEILTMRFSLSLLLFCLTLDCCCVTFKAVVFYDLTC